MLVRSKDLTLTWWSGLEEDGQRCLASIAFSGDSPSRWRMVEVTERSSPTPRTMVATGLVPFQPP